MNISSIINNFTTTENETRIEEVLDFYAYSDIIMFFVIVISNSFVLYLFFVKTHLRTPFSVYVISLLISNILTHCVFIGPLSIINSFSSYWWMGSFACLFYQYGNWVVSGGCSAAHTLIVVNRIWGLAFPLSYRNVHSKSLAIILCIASWIFVHVVCLPGVAIDAAFHFGFDIIIECAMTMHSTGQRIWIWIAMVVIFDLPIILIVVAYPFFLYLHIKRRRNLRELVSRHTNTNNGRKETNANYDKNVHAFAVLTFMTFSLVICWAPADILWIIADTTPAWLLILSSFLYQLQAVLDPIMFILCLKDLRAVVVECLFCCGRQTGKVHG